MHSSPARTKGPSTTPVSANRTSTDMAQSRSEVKVIGAQKLSEELTQAEQEAMRTRATGAAKKTEVARTDQKDYEGSIATGLAARMGKEEPVKAAALDTGSAKQVGEGSVESLAQFGSETRAAIAPRGNAASRTR